MSLRFPLLGAAVGAVLALSAGQASEAQSLLDDMLPQVGVCTCAEVTPPYDCAAELSKPQQMASEQRRQFRAQCATDWRKGCEERNGWQACATAEANRQLAAQCDALAERWYKEVAAPQIDEMSRQCNAANAQWTRQCETVERPKNCGACTDMSAEIAQIERQIAEAQGWIDRVRSGEELITSETEAEMAQRVDDIDRLERELNEKRNGYSVMQSTDFCPKT